MTNCQSVTIVCHSMPVDFLKKYCKSSKLNRYSTFAQEIIVVHFLDPKLFQISFCLSWKEY